MSETPIKNKLLINAKSVTIPPSPQMQTLGYGTGVTVYKMERTQNRSPWVLKKISRKARSIDEMSVRLNFEAQILRQLKHPNIVGFRAFLTESDGRKCIAMEDCTISLGDLIEKLVDEQKDFKPFPAKKIEKVAYDIAKGLKYLHHEALILHCDIKSFNILIKNNFEICKLCDFGVSMPLKSDGTLDYAKAGVDAEYVGTQPWCAPEIIQEGQIISNKADIYSYGLCLWEMIALDTPFLEDYDISSELSSLDVTEELDKSYITPVPRERPTVPCEHLDDTYLSILQLYYLCTEQDYKLRPNAEHLCKIIKELYNSNLYELDSNKSED